MQRMKRRLLALLLAALLAVAALLPAAMAEDWRGQLRDAFGLTDEAAPTPKPAKASKSTADPEPSKRTKQWTLPITDAQQIVNYLDTYGKLPDNFITKKEARNLGWDSSWNYVGEVAPGMSIGGDRFGNYEGQLPEKNGRIWRECDVGYQGRKRNARRLLYSSDGLYYYTEDHYNTFKQMFPED